MIDSHPQAGNLNLLIDNYDSFTYNLVDYFAQLRFDCRVIRNDELSLADIEALNPSSIILSPGPETPSRAGVMMDVIAHFHARLPLLGICLGHQGIGQHFGARLVRAPRVVHGKTSPVYHNGHPVFRGITSPFDAMRYHSLILEEVHRTPLEVIARTAEAEVMAVVHPQLNVCGLQFHPESILTGAGLAILRNWIEWSRARGHRGSGS